MQKKEQFCPRGHDTSIQGRTENNSCRDCRREDWRTWYDALPEDRKQQIKDRRRDLRLNGPSDRVRQTPDERRAKRKTWQQKYRREHPEHTWKAYIKEAGMTPEAYQKQFDKQGGRCAICRQPERMILNGKPKRLAIDHDHATGELRALLCFRCNQILGFSEDSVVRLFSAISYLKQYQRIEEVG